MRRLKFFLIIILILAAAIIVFVLVIKSKYKREKNMIYGATFNSEYAVYLGLNARDAFNKILGEWNFKHIRLSAQWDLIEKIKGEYDWSELDWMMNEAAKKNAKIILAVGHRTPRWPECHYPKWIDPLTHFNHWPELLRFMELTVNRYKNHPALEVWQVENEPFLRFGICDVVTDAQLDEELKLVKKIDPFHPTMVTDSGELSMWRKTAKRADLFGTTLYRVVWSKQLGYWNYKWLLPPFVYQARLWLNKRDINTAYISELQAEPWIADKKLDDEPLAEQFKSMSLKQLKENINFAVKTKMPRAYLWGAEWWLWLESHGAPEFSAYIKNLPKN